MTWANGNLQIYNTFASLVRRNGDVMTVNSDCLDTLEEINKELSTEDCNLRTFRRAIGFSKNIQNDLIPLLIHLKENKNVTNANEIVNCTIKLLVNLTIPTEYLLPLEMMGGSDVGKHSIFELNSLLSASKESFSDSRSTKAVLDHIKQMIDCDSPLTFEQCDSINNCLLLLRNILHIPEIGAPGGHSTLQNQILWNLFTQSVDKIIIFLITCPQKLFWSVTMVQLIAMLYKDQHVGTLQKLLNLWLEASLSESSEDNESNTSAPFQGNGDCSPSDPTSDSSDTGGGNHFDKGCVNSAKEVRAPQSRNKPMSEIKRVQSTETDVSSSSGISSMVSQSTTSKSQSSVHTDQCSNSKKRECPSLTGEISDCGYGTQVENQEFVSTSSNDDDQPSQKPVHIKPHTFQKTIRYNSVKKTTTTLENKELRRKKMVKRSKTNIINVKGLMHHLPTDEDISNVLKEFTVDFLLKGYGMLVKDLHAQLLNNVHVPIDTSHFFWLVTYFLKFATQLELDMEHLIPVLSYDLLSYLVFQGVWTLEEFELKTSLMYVDLKPCLRRLHLVVTAIREFLQAVDTYQKIIQLNEEDKYVLHNLKAKIAGTHEIGSLFLLLLRHYNGRFQSRQYLQDLILTNHMYLLFLDNLSTSDIVPKLSLMEHLKKFAAVEIMCQYGILLESFRENGEYINNCIFTMMHHIGGDIDRMSILFQPNILKIFSQIWKTDFELCDDWADLVEYVIHKFINITKKTHCLYDKKLEGTSVNESTENSEKSKCTKDQKIDILSQNEEKNEDIDETTTKYKSGMKDMTQFSLMKELLLQNVISKKQYEDFTKIEQPEIKQCREKTKDEQNGENELLDNEVEALRSYLVKEGRENHVLWLQDVLLEFCYAKLLLEKPEKFEGCRETVEPTIYYNTLLNLHLSLVHWTTDQSLALKFPPFIVLLQKLGFYLPSQTGKLFVHIPNFWTAGVIYGKAQQLGPIKRDKIKFDYELLDRTNKEQEVCLTKLAKNITGDPTRFFNACQETPYMFRYTPLPNSEWKPILSINSSFGNIDIDRTQELNITIPEQESSYDSPLQQIETSNNTHSRLLSIMDRASAFEEADCISACGTISSSFTGMCVSDEDNTSVWSLDQRLG